jgi:outer membrane protein OmpA-like peptidoglycan-associated protein
MSNNQSFDLNQDVSSQLDNFVNLLVELDVIERPESVSKSPVEIQNDENDSTEQAELLICDAHLELVESSSGINYSQIEIPILDVDIQNIQEKSTPDITNSNQILDPTSGNYSSEETIDAFQKLQDILVGAELSDLQHLTHCIQENLTKLENQIYEPQKLIDLLLPYMGELLKLKVIESQEEIVQAIYPIIDQVIKSRVEQDRASMGNAIASAVPLAISQQINFAPEEISEAIAPTMGRAIKKQIQIEQDTIVDALYPIIGSTISKYMVETIRAINQQVEEAFSAKGIQRKITAKLQGVSEAELILRQAISFSVQAIFLIHKTSGLVITDIQKLGEQQLESEMVAGMLTAIRSFANDCMTHSGTVSELNTIDYGKSKIILETAGYCYLAIVTEGEATKDFIKEMRIALSHIVKNYGDSIEQFDGNPATIPADIHQLLQPLKDNNSSTSASQSGNSQTTKVKNKTSPLLILSLSVLSLILVPWGVWQYRAGIIHSAENTTATALASTPELSVYRLNVTEKNSKLSVTGRLPNQALREKAEQIAKQSAPKWLIDNQILAVEVPPDPVLTAAEVKRVTKVLNQIDGINISAGYSSGKVSVDGSVFRSEESKKIQNAFEQIPGVKSLSSTVRIQPFKTGIRFYFEGSSAYLSKKDFGYKLQQVKFFLNQHPTKNFKIIGYSNSEDNQIEAQQIALTRAKAVKKALIYEGIEPSRLQVTSAKGLSPGIDGIQPAWLRRCVALELVK